MADSIHCIKKTLRLKPAEAEVLASKAAEAGMCEAGYLRLLITQKPYDYPETRSLLKTLINEVNAVGNNINQITRANNSYFYSREDKELLAAYMKKIQQAVQEVAERLAVSKILCIGSCGAGYAGKHLSQALEYIYQKKKNRGGQVGGLLKLSAREYIPADAADKGTFWKDR